MRIALLGPLEVRDDAGVVVGVSGARLRALLARLAVDAPRPVSSSALVEAVWGDEPPDDETNALQSLVSRLRRALGDGGLVVQAGTGYRLEVARADVDVHRFTALARRGADQLRTGDAETAARTLREALLLWRTPDGEPWAELHGPGPLARFSEQRLEAMADLFEAEIASGRHRDVVVELDELVTRFPLRERFVGLFMRALTAGRRRSEALECYERLRRRLADELGVDPSAELQAIHLSILRGEGETPAPQRQSARAPARGNLKAALTSFVGREEELARITKLLDECRLVTLVGPGGAGKTRLANVAASAVVEQVPDGVWLAELAPVTDPHDVPAAVLDALDLRDPVLLDRTSATTPSAVRDPTARLIDAFAGRRAVLVLDNCEHLVDAAARLADELLARCPLLRIVATSREPLGILGETLVVVPPLAQPAEGDDAESALGHPSVRLFVDRAAAVDPGFDLDETNVADVVEIVRRLDGLPLAIELAAARLRTLPVGDIASRLSDRFRLLTGGSRTAMPRHRTLRAVVEWSWELLDDSERLLAERLAVFAGTIAAADAREVCADHSLSADVIDDLLASLVEKSLLQRVSDDGGQRYRMLETLREFGLDKMATRTEVGTLRRRHATHFADVVKHAAPLVRTRDQLRWMARLEGDRENILAGLRFLCDSGSAEEALDVAVALATYWTLTGRDRDSSYWLSIALQTSGRAHPATRLVAESLHSVTTLASAYATSPADVEQNLRAVRGLSRRLAAIRPPFDPMLAVLRPVVAFFADEEPAVVERLVAEGLASSDAWVAATVRMFRAAIAENSGDVTTMRADVDQAIELFRELGERWGLASSLGMRAQLKTLDADLGGAIVDLEEGLELTAMLSGHDDATMLNVRLAELRLRTGDVAAARACVDALRRIAEASGSTMHLLLAAMSLAEIERYEGDVEQARARCDDLLGRLAGIPAVHPVQGHLTAMILTFAAKISIEDGALAQAAEQLRVAYRDALATKDMPIVASVVVTAACWAFASGQAHDAAELLGAAARLRGAEDPTQPDIARLTADLRDALGADGFATAYDAGRALDAEAARLRVDQTLGQAR